MTKKEEFSIAFCELLQRKGSVSLDYIIEGETYLAFVWIYILPIFITALHDIFLLN